MAYVQRTILEEIYRWKALDVKTLKTLISYPSKPKCLRQLLLKMERRNQINSTRVLWSKNKIFFLSELGFAELGFAKSESIKIARELIGHQSLCAKAVSDMMDLPNILGFKSESELTSETGLLPDAIITGEKNGVPFKLALEMELTKKSKLRIIEKLKIYANSFLYGYVLYLFPTIKMRNDWEQLLKENIKPDSQRRFLLFSFENNRGKNFADSVGKFQGKEQFLKEVFA